MSTNSQNLYVLPKTSDFLVGKFNAEFSKKKSNNFLPNMDIEELKGQYIKALDYISLLQDERSLVQGNMPKSQAKKYESELESTKLSFSAQSPSEKLSMQTFSGNNEFELHQIKELKQENAKLKKLANEQCLYINQLQVELNSNIEKSKEIKKLKEKNNILQNQMKNLNQEFSQIYERIIELENENKVLLAQSTIYTNNTNNNNGNNTKKATHKDNINNDDEHTISILTYYFNFVLHILEEFDKNHFVMICFIERFLKHTSNTSTDNDLKAKKFDNLCVKAFKYFTDLIINIHSMTKVSNGIISPIESNKNTSSNRENFQKFEFPSSTRKPDHPLDNHHEHDIKLAKHKLIEPINPSQSALQIDPKLASLENFNKKFISSRTNKSPKELIEHKISSTDKSIGKQSSSPNLFTKVQMKITNMNMPADKQLAKCQDTSKKSHVSNQGESGIILKNKKTQDNPNPEKFDPIINKNPGSITLLKPLNLEKFLSKSKQLQANECNRSNSNDDNRDMSNEKDENIRDSRNNPRPSIKENYKELVKAVTSNAAKETYLANEVLNSEPSPKNSLESLIHGSKPNEYNTSHSCYSNLNFTQLSKNPNYNNNANDIKAGKVNKNHQHFFNFPCQKESELSEYLNLNDFKDSSSQTLQKQNTVNDNNNKQVYLSDKSTKIDSNSGRPLQLNLKSEIFCC